MEREMSVNQVRASCPFCWYDIGGWTIQFPYQMMKDMICLWQYTPPRKLGKGILAVPEGFEEFHTIGVGVVLSAGPGYHDKKGKWVPTNPNLQPGSVVEYDKTIPWSFPENVLDILGDFHSLPMCPAVNIFGVYE